ncbi:SDR family oxidoreductase [Paraflavitalea sp. CAU 1676]|uniref:SDR family oxidoreductase n=1 Tax=Paraflavitalea sp. CAU 1676 TaxID=3032598 RepID=UPI0023DAE78C|nr:SDR family oxidoreductase [Paraflavitalea sp. CAU 1676]MDF2193717.1 SDR family oxidoreductase [Paraflavitalea sp. CAU 1676]
MKIVVIGGTGLIGSKVVGHLRKWGHEVVVASPATGINTITGEGLEEAMNNTDVVVDLANSPSFEDKAVLEFFQTAGRNLLAAEAKAGVKHHIALSIVGVDQMQNLGYMRAKLVQEDLIKKSGIPYTILRSTQFFEFLPGIAGEATRDNEVHLSAVKFQPIAANDVGLYVAQAVVAAPLNGVLQIAGPDRAPMFEVVDKYLRYVKDPRPVIPNGESRYFGGDIGDTSLVPSGEVKLGELSFDKWLTTIPKA